MLEEHLYISNYTMLPYGSQARSQECIANYIISLLKDNKYTLPEARYLLYSILNKIEKNSIISEMRD